MEKIIFVVKGTGYKYIQDYNNETIPRMGDIIIKIFADKDAIDKEIDFDYYIVNRVVFDYRYKSIKLELDGYYFYEGAL